MKGGKSHKANPTVDYLLKGSGGKSSVVKGSDEILRGGVKQGEKAAGGKRFDLTKHSLNRGK